jgi:hypothetical protein
LGSGALAANTTGGPNTAVGFSSLGANTTGNNNAAVGDYALAANTTGSDNIAVGNGAGWNLTAGSNNILVGNPGVTAESNTIRIGNTQTATYIAGVFSQVAGGGVGVLVNSAGKLGSLPSSARFKDDIEDMGDASSGLMQLRPVRFRYKPDIDPSGLEQYGLVAEEVAKVYPDMVVHDDKGQPQTVRYHFVNAMLLNEVQKQARQIGTQAEQIETQKAQIAAQTQRIEEQARQLTWLTEQVAQLGTVGLEARQR